MPEISVETTGISIAIDRVSPVVRPTWQEPAAGDAAMAQGAAAR